MAHGTVNAVAGLGTVVTTPDAPSLLGPTAVGVVVALPWVALAAWLLVDPGLRTSGPPAA